jgi:hypothetical protein
MSRYRADLGMALIMADLVRTWHRPPRHATLTEQGVARSGPPCMELFAKTYYCPDLVSQEDAIVIEETLQNSPGIDEISVDHAAHTVLVSTANQDGLRDVEIMLREAGFAPEDRDDSAGEVGIGTSDPKFYTS